MALCLSLSCKKFDDSAIWDKLNDHEKRLVELEILCEQMNINITSLRSIIEALQKNDYMTAFTPINDNGREIGYIIALSSGKTITIYHGLNGKDGQDGYTPLIGVKQDSDGLFYWTLDGEWLKDADDNKIPTTGKDGEDGKDGQDGAHGEDGKDGQDGAPGKDGKDGQDGAPGKDGEDGQDGAPGKDGKDGITPQLKIENDYWLISYDNGNTWAQLGEATGEDGKDGKNGDSFFKTVTQDTNNVYLQLSDGTTIAIPLASNYLFNKIQSLNYIPTYNDGFATVVYGDYDDATVEMDFEVFPKTTLEDIYSNWANLLSMKAVYTMTRSTVTFIDMPIISCSIDKEKGILSVTVSGTNLSEDFFNGVQSANARLAVSDDNNCISSAYIPLTSEKVKPAGNEIWYTTTDGLVLKPKDASAIDAAIISNVYEDGKGVITFDKNITVIGTAAFNSLSRLTSVDIPDSVVEIGWLAFNNCENLTDLRLSRNLERIGNRAFSLCEELVDFVLPPKLKSIGDNAFSSCQSLTSVHLPNSLEELGNAVFYYCTNITSFTGKFVYEGGTCIIYNDTINSMRRKGLTEFTVPDNVKHIGYESFRSMSLNRLTMNDKIESIGIRAFFMSYISELRFPASLKEIHSYAFASSSLKKCYFESTIPPTAVVPEGFSVWSAFQSINDYTIYVPQESVELYKTAYGWKEYADHIQPIPSHE